MTFPPCAVGFSNFLYQGFTGTCLNQPTTPQFLEQRHIAAHMIESFSQQV